MIRRILTWLGLVKPKRSTIPNAHRLHHSTKRSGFVRNIDWNRMRIRDINRMGGC